MIGQLKLRTIEVDNTLSICLYFYFFVWPQSQKSSLNFHCRKLPFRSSIFPGQAVLVWDFSLPGQDLQLGIQLRMFLRNSLIPENLICVGTKLVQNDLKEETTWDWESTECRGYVKTSSSRFSICNWSICRITHTLKIKKRGVFGFQSEWLETERSENHGTSVNPVSIYDGKTTPDVLSSTFKYTGGGRVQIELADLNRQSSNKLLVIEKSLKF